MLFIQHKIVVNIWILKISRGQTLQVNENQRLDYSLKISEVQQNQAVTGIDRIQLGYCNGFQSRSVRLYR